MTFLQKTETLAMQVRRHAWNAQNLVIREDPRWLLCACGAYALPPFSRCAFACSFPFTGPGIRVRNSALSFEGDQKIPCLPNVWDLLLCEELLGS